MPAPDNGLDKPVPATEAEIETLFDRAVKGMRLDAAPGAIPALYRLRAIAARVSELERELTEKTEMHTELREMHKQMCDIAAERFNEIERLSGQSSATSDIEKERDACADLVFKMMTAWGDYGDESKAQDLADAIRARSDRD